MIFVANCHDVNNKENKINNSIPSSQQVMMQRAYQLTQINKSNAKNSFSQLPI